MRVRRVRTAWLIAPPVAPALILVAVSAGINEPLRGHLERRANAALIGYQVRLGGLHLHPLGFSIDFYDLTVSQSENPEP